MAKQKLPICTQCGSKDWEEIAWNRRRCRYCGTEWVVGEDYPQLQDLHQVCPKCRYHNPAETLFCQQCGEALTKKCPICGKEEYSGVRFCGRCGFDYSKATNLQKNETELKEAKTKLQTGERYAALGAFLLAFALFAGLIVWHAGSPGAGILAGVAIAAIGFVLLARNLQQRKALKENVEVLEKQKQVLQPKGREKP